MAPKAKTCRDIIRELMVIMGAWPWQQEENDWSTRRVKIHVVSPEEVHLSLTCTPFEAREVLRGFLSAAVPAEEK